MVLHEVSDELNFHALLLALDRHAAQQVRLQGCGRCGGPLYAAHYPRKPRGLGAAALEAGGYEKRLSLCCGREGCRARATPPSVRFLGRRIYAALVVLLLSLQQALAWLKAQAFTIEQGPQAPAWWTRQRWCCWWRDELWSCAWFSQQRAHFAIAPEPSRAPDCLLALFWGDVHERVRRLLVMLSPLTTQSLAAENSRIAMAG